jgi:hypothetical protein
MQFWFSSLCVKQVGLRVMLYVNLLSGSTWLESWLGHQLSWVKVFMGLLSLPGKCWGSALIFFHIVSSSLFMYNSAIHHYVVSTLKALLNKQESWLFLVLYIFGYVLSFTYVSSTYRIHFRAILENLPHFLSQKTIILWSVLFHCETFMYKILAKIALHFQIWGSRSCDCKDCCLFGCDAT